MREISIVSLPECTLWILFCNDYDYMSQQKNTFSVAGRSDFPSVFGSNFSVHMDTRYAHNKTLWFILIGMSIPNCIGQKNWRTNRSFNYKLAAESIALNSNKSIK